MLKNLLKPVYFQVLRTCSERFPTNCSQFCGVPLAGRSPESYNAVSGSTCWNQQARWLRTATTSRKGDDRRSIYASVPSRDEGVDGEKSFDLNVRHKSRSFMFPDEDTPNMLVDGVRFCELPIVHIKSTKNNTIFGLTDHKGGPILLRSCGMEGFKNAKKGTNIAAQATAINACMKALEMGIKNVRVKIRGLGPGRMSSIKGMQMAGMNIVSISDTTPAEPDCPRPRKARRL